MIKMSNTTVLMVIDVQKAFEDKKWGTRNNRNTEENIRILLENWRKKQFPVIHIQHISDKENSLFYPSKESFKFKEIANPIDDEIVFNKTVNSAFIGTNLEKYLKRHNIKEVVIVGLTTPHCVSTTTRMSGNLGFNTYLVSDATAAFELKGADGVHYSAEQVHNVSLATLHDEFATVLTTKELLAILE